MDLKPEGNFVGLNILLKEDQDRFFEILEECATQASKLQHAQFGNRMANSQNSDAGLVLSVDPAPVLPREMLPIKLTENLGAGKYAYIEQQPKFDDAGDDVGEWEDKSIGAAYQDASSMKQFYRSGECWEANKNPTVPVESFQMAYVKYTSGRSPVIRFEYCCHASSSG